MHISFLWIFYIFARISIWLQSLSDCHNLVLVIRNGTHLLQIGDDVKETIQASIYIRTNS